MRCLRFRHLLIVLGIITEALGAQASDGNIRFSGMKWSAGAGLAHNEYSFSDATASSGQATANGIDLSLRANTPVSGGEHTPSIGLELGQFVASRFLATRLGVRLESWVLEPATSLALTWYFGDTFVARDHDRQYNGDSASLSVSHEWNGFRGYIEGRVGSYREGPGFITLARAPGADQSGERGLTIGIITPL